ncbi:DNA topoisomerase 2-associated protein pat1 [Cryptotrichosporon argae]
MSFFGFDTTLPGRTGQPGAPAQFTGFGTASTGFDGVGTGAGETEDLAVYQWGDGLLDGGDDFNDETFGGGDVGNDFDFGFGATGAHAGASADSYGYGGMVSRMEGIEGAVKRDAKPKIASTQSRFGRKTVVDPFAASEDDFYGSRPTKKTTKKKEPTPEWAKPSAAAPLWGAAPSSIAKPHVPAPSSSAPHDAPGQILSLDEIEAQLSRTAVSERPPMAPVQPPSQQKVLTLEEIESQLVSEPPPAPAAASPAPFAQPPAPGQPAPALAPAPTPLPLESGYASQQALLDSIFPDVGGQPAGVTGVGPGQPQPPAPSPEELARIQALQERVRAKIEAMSRHNNLMGNSDKDFITRIQLSQLATQDPYSSDFYAQVFSALVRSRQQDAHGPNVVQLGRGIGFGVGAAGNRFGKMGNNTMQRLTTQVKRIVATKDKRQQNMSNAALQGALGRVSRASTAAPRPVLAMPAAGKPEHRPTATLNQSSVTQRPALTKKQVMYALEKLYDDVLELEQLRRDAPPPTDVAAVAAWNAQAQRVVDRIWAQLMVLEPLGISAPHPFISLLNAAKGQRLFPRLLRHLGPQQSLALLTLLIATYPQLDVVARAAPPPAADPALLTRADRLDRQQREADTDTFLHCVVPGIDALINTCSLGTVAGLLGVCSQMMEVWKVACTRPGVALFTALCSKAQSVIRSSPEAPQPDPAEVEQWSKQFAYFLQSLLPHLPDLFPSSQTAKAAFGATAYLVRAEPGGGDEREGMEHERREAEVWGLAAALAVNAPEDEQTNLVGALREKILHTVQAARSPATPSTRAELKLRNVNMFLHGLGLDASMIE